MGEQGEPSDVALGGLHSAMLTDASKAILPAMFQDESSKDAQIQCSDGCVGAHAAVLSAISAPFKAMLHGGFAESKDYKVQMPDFSVEEVDFILHSIYTGQLKTSAEETESINADRYPGLQTAAQFKVIMDELQAAEGHDARQASHAKLMDFWRLLPEACRRKMFRKTLREKVQIVHDLERNKCMQLKLQNNLFALAAFSRKYDMPDFATAAVEMLKQSITDDSFDGLLCSAVRLDIMPVRLALIDFAKGSESIRNRFDRCDLSPEVMWDLQAIWQAPTGQKRRRLTRTKN
mmetsp:Transcript_106406/g.185074  ORF Transcript_106406/g.185074 Transcript_106406/m.185074 type:complete len:291 (+) Transcript_106406:190-1062(+)